MRKLLFVLGTSILLSSLPLSAEVLELNLEQAMDLALEKNINIRSAKEDLTKAKAQRKEAFASALPVLSGFGQLAHNFSLASQPMSFPVPFGVIDGAGNPVPLLDDSGNPVPFRDANGIPVPGQSLQMTGVQLIPVDLAFGNDNTLVYGLNLTQPLFEGRVIAAIRGANVYDDLAQSAVEVTRISVIEKTKQAFYQVLLADKMSQVMENSLAVMERNLQNVQALFEQGKIAEFDVIRADVQVANQTTVVSNARKMQTLAHAGFKRTCGLEMDKDILLKGTLEVEIDTALNFPELEAKMLAAQPLLSQLDASERLMKENILMAKAEFMPSVALSGSYMQNLPYNDGDFENAEFRESSSLSLGINMPIFNGFGSVAKVQQAKADHRKSEYQFQDIKENLRLELKNIYLNIQESARKIEAGRKGVSQAKRGVDMAQRLFQQGMASQLQVLDAQNASDQAELGLYQAYYEYNSARASLTRALGED